jgi:hypothetical protein
VLTFVDQTTILASSISERVSKNEIALLGSWTDTHIEIVVDEIGSDHINIRDKFGSFNVGAANVKRKISRVLASKILYNDDRSPESITDEEANLLPSMLIMSLTNY